MGDVDSFLEEQLASVKSGPGPARKQKADQEAAAAGKGVGDEDVGNGLDNENGHAAAAEPADAEQNDGSSSSDSSSDGSSSGSEDEAQGNEQEGEEEVGGEEENGGEGESGDGREAQEDEEDAEDEDEEDDDEKKHGKRSSRDKDRRKRSRSRGREGRDSSDKRRRRYSEALRLALSVWVLWVYVCVLRVVCCPRFFDPGTEKWKVLWKIGTQGNITTELLIFIGGIVYLFWEPHAVVSWRSLAYAIVGTGAMIHCLAWLQAAALLTKRRRTTAFRQEYWIQLYAMIIIVWPSGNNTIISMYDIIDISTINTRCYMYDTAVYSFSHPSCIFVSPLVIYLYLHPVSGKWIPRTHR